jgi:hypothetical protein
VEELRDRVHSLERRLDEAEASRRRADDIIEQQLTCLCQASPPPSVIRGALAEGANELARKLVPTLVSGFVFAPASLGAVISYLNNAPYLALALVVVGVVTGLAGT